MRDSEGYQEDNQLFEQSVGSFIGVGISIKKSDIHKKQYIFTADRFPIGSYGHSAQRNPTKRIL